jgi:hypothetical protein
MIQMQKYNTIFENHPLDNYYQAICQSSRDGDSKNDNCDEW